MLKYASTSKSGDRKCNEDCLKICNISDRYCFVVCDGLGGYELGDIASQTVANTFADELYYNDDMESFLKDTFAKAQQNVLAKQKEQNGKNKMSTTAVVLACDLQNAYVGHVGDSRFYGFKTDGEYIRTLDHSVPQILVQSNTIDEKDIRNHPNRNMLLKVLGEKTEEQLCDLIGPFPLSSYKAFLLCTDGFWELIEESEMLSTMASSATPQEWLDKMSAIVENNGKGKNMDNYSAIAVFNVE